MRGVERWYPGFTHQGGPVEPAAYTDPERSDARTSA